MSCFVGREWIKKDINGFLKENSKGYFFIKGGPGTGKSAIAAQLVKESGYVHHFNIRSESNNNARKFYKNVCAQLIGRYKLDHDSLSDEETENANFLTTTLFNQITQEHNEPIIIVVDALDEVDQKERQAGVNILNLPDTLPKGFYIIVTLRTNSDVKLPRNDGIKDPKEIEIIQDSEQNLSDVEKYLKKKIKLKGIQNFIESQKKKSFNEESFIKLLKEKSQGNFMFLKYVLNDIALGKYQDKDIDSIPVGLEKYYENHWEMMSEVDKTGWADYKMPTIIALAVAKSPINIDQISRFSKVKDESKTFKVLKEWAQFLHKEKYDVKGKLETRYRLYHASFQDFIKKLDEISESGVDLKEAEKKLVDSFEWPKGYRK